jgi:hypothetical protein
MLCHLSQKCNNVYDNYKSICYIYDNYKSIGRIGCGNHRKGTSSQTWLANAIIGERFKFSRFFSSNFLSDNLFALLNVCSLCNLSLFASPIINFGFHNVCRYKIYIEGSAWSVSEKYILACDSVSFLVKPHYYDFFTRSLKPMHHYWPIRDDDKCRSIKFAVDWGNAHMKKVILYLGLFNRCCR